MAKLLRGMLSAVQDCKTQLLAQRAKLKELFDSVLHKSMAGEYEKSKFTPLDTKLSNGAWLFNSVLAKSFQHP